MTATQRQLGISVLAAPLAAIDRRSLSQAWYSALHLAHSSPLPAGSALPAPEKPAASSPLQLRRDAAPRRAVPLAPVRPGAPRRPPAVAGAACERRAPRSPLARGIERAMLDRSAASGRSAFAIKTGETRVVVVLHARGNRVRLVALCAPASRRAVARALEQARFALAARGIALDAHLGGDVRCS